MSKKSPLAAQKHQILRQSPASSFITTNGPWNVSSDFSLFPLPTFPLPPLLNFLPPPRHTPYTTTTNILHIHIYYYQRIHMYYYHSFPAQKCSLIKKRSARDRITQRDGARLPYFTRTGGHHVCIPRKGDPAQRLLTNRGQEKHLFDFRCSHETTRLVLKQITL